MHDGVHGDERVGPVDAKGIGGVLDLRAPEPWLPEPLGDDCLREALLERFAECVRSDRASRRVGVRQRVDELVRGPVVAGLVHELAYDFNGWARRILLHRVRLPS